MVHKNKFTFSLKNKKYQINLNENQLEQLPTSVKNTSISPNGEQAVFIKEGNLYLKNLKNGSISALSAVGSKSYSYGSAYGWSQVMTGENAEPKPRLKVKWSPDSKKLFTQISDTRGAKKMYMLNWFTDSLYRPELLSYYRTSPGDTAFVKLIQVVFDIQSHKMTSLDLKPTPQMVDLGLNLHWTKGSQHLVGTYDRRGFKKKDIIDVNPHTGRVNILYTDSSSTNIDFHAQFRFVQEDNPAILTSEKSGWKQLYLLHWETAKLQPITHGDFVVKEIKTIDAENHKIYFTVAGREKGVNPYYNMLYKINYDGTGLVLLTPESAIHQVFISPNFDCLIDNLSTAEKLPISLLRDTETGKTLLTVEKADIKDLKILGWKPPLLFTAIAKDKKSILYGALWKPTDFDPDQKYPLVDYTYTGPHTNVFPNTFSKGLYGLYDSAQSLAELGFIVMQIDGKGANGRSKTFHNASYKNLGNNLKDHTGGIDENVNPSATFKLSEALIKAGKYFDLLIIPSAGHHFSKAYNAYVQEKRWNFFVENLK